MSHRRIDGTDLEKMFKCAYDSLSSREKEINDLNVFPVADGDTGTNMLKTLEHGIKDAKSDSRVYAFLKGLSSGMLMGARGNSGVILSQFFSGFYSALAKKELIGPGELRNSLIYAYRNAYKAVMKPVEGTMLTVAREGIENIRLQITRASTIEEILNMYIVQMKKTLAFTPELLSVLKEAGVVDSGSVGLVAIFEGMLESLYGKKAKGVKPVAEEKKAPAETAGYFDENSSFEYGYCLEFILQLMNTGNYNRYFSLDKFRGDLSLLGESIVAAKDGSKVKVHIHTHHPSRVISLGEEYGVFVDFKLDNMQLQHNEHKKESEKKKKDIATVAALSSDGYYSLYTSLGCDEIISCESGMNVSTEQFYEKIKKASAKNVVVLVNNKNAVFSARSAAGMIDDGTKVTLIETNNEGEGYICLGMDVRDSEDIPYRISQFVLGSEGLSSCYLARASKDYSADISCKKGDYLFLIGEDIVYSSPDKAECVRGGFEKTDLGEYETCIVFSKEYPDEILKECSDKYPLTDVEQLEVDTGVYEAVMVFVK